MNLDQFYSQTNGQSLLYPPNPESIRGQCFQLIMFYVTQVWNQRPLWYAYAYQLMNVSTDTYDVTINNPSDENQLPQRGDVIVWSKDLPGSGDSGHTAIFWQNNGNHTFVSYDTNWGGKTAHLVTHNWQYVVGWFRPKGGMGSGVAQSTNTSNGDEMIANEQQAHQAYQLLRPNGDGSTDEISNTAGKRTWANFANDSRNEMNARNQALSDQSNQLNSLRDTINTLNNQVTQLQTQGATDQATIQSKIGDIATLTAQLSTTHDQLAVLQAKVTAVQTLTEVQNVITNQEVTTTTETPKKSKSTLLVKLLAAVLVWRKKKTK